MVYALSVALFPVAAYGIADKKKHNKKASEGVSYADI
ncbi:protein of unknown function [Methanoculleus bourgensis]|uniref:Uncharacterized protein n=1 Tax=Methanoculleus bourgensis TaxID=83986 RepID=A0A0X3BJU5_9EURY|nr:protein of unknown function [Methanoculleus bourgensis]